jgi:hypothetical protein
MRKNKVTPLTVSQAPAKADYSRGTVPWGHDITGQAMGMVQQLETVARRLAGMPGDDTESGLADLTNVMALFAENLQQVADMLDEVRMVMEDADPTILTAVNG